MTDRIVSRMVLHTSKTFRFRGLSTTGKISRLRRQSRRNTSTTIERWITAWLTFVCRTMHKSPPCSLRRNPNVASPANNSAHTKSACDSQRLRECANGSTTSAMFYQTSTRSLAKSQTLHALPIFFSNAAEPSCKIRTWDRSCKKKKLFFLTRFFFRHVAPPDRRTARARKKDTGKGPTRP